MTEFKTFSDGDIFFASPRARWYAQAKHGLLSAYEPASAALVQTLMTQAQRQGIAEPVLFGVIPFHADQPASVSIPGRIQPSTDGHFSTLPVVKTRAVARTTLTPSPEQYAQKVRQALALMERQDLRKIVLARTMDIDLDVPLDLPHLLLTLCQRHQQGYIFALPLWEKSSRASVGMMIGASPELLLRRQGHSVYLNPLAGSIARDANPERDAQQRSRLAQSEKDRCEHAYVVQAIAQILREYCVDLHVPAQPVLMATDTLWHLSTVITGQLRHAENTALDLALALHPTPAICGTPTFSALQYLPTLEPFAREYYGGFVGWQRANGDGEWALTLRCARYTEQKHLRLYAGAGIVAGSDPDQEVIETQIKLKTFLRALQPT